jgi:CBS-domain-containing membrane protein
MTRSLLTVSPDDDADAAADSMSARQVRRLPSHKTENWWAMVSLADLARRSPAVKKLPALSEISVNIRRR